MTSTTTPTVVSGKGALLWAEVKWMPWMHWSMNLKSWAFQRSFPRAWQALFLLWSWSSLPFHISFAVLLTDRNGILFIFHSFVSIGTGEETILYKHYFFAMRSMMTDRIWINFNFNPHNVCWLLWFSTSPTSILALFIGLPLVNLH